MLIDGKRILRVFPKRMASIPDDDYAIVGDPGLFRPQADEVHVSCTFTWHRDEADRLANAWATYYPIVKRGGPAYDDPGGEFTPGLYLRLGYVQTSRGCPNKCSYCAVPKREGPLRTLQIKDGYRIEDNNLLACPREHIEAVFAMLERQPQRAILSGGLDARLLEPWMAEAMKRINVQTVYLAYDTPGQQKHVERSIKMLRDAGLKVGTIRCYVLCGHEGDTVEAAEERCVWLSRQGCVPFAMYWRPYDCRVWEMPPEPWKTFVPNWIWAKCIWARLKEKYGLESKHL